MGVEIKNSKVIIICLFFLINSSIFPQWISAGNTFFSQTINLGAIDSSYAIISGTNQGLYKTTNGGSSWELFNNPIASSIIGLSFVDTFHIWIAGESAIYKSTDGGNTWIEQYNDTTQTDFFNYIKMFDLNNGIAMGDAKSDTKPALFLQTTNGGNNWIPTNSSKFIGKGSGDLWRRLDFTDINTGYFFPSLWLGGKNIYKTTDGGFTWSLTNYDGYVWVMRFFNNDIGIASPSGNQIMRTLDGGQTWDTFSSPNQNWALDFRFDPNDASRVWLLTDDLYFSADTGRTWRTEVSKAFGYVMSMVNSHIAWLSGGGSVFRTNNAGDTFVSVESEPNAKVENFELLQNYPNPFNPTTIITYRLNYSSNVKLIVYNSMGEEHATLLNAYKNSGEYSIYFDGSGLSSGVYFYQLITQNNVVTRKMILLR